MILFALDQDLHGTFGKGNFAGESHEVFVPEAAPYSGRLKQVLQVVCLDQIVRRKDRLHIFHPSPAPARRAYLAPSASIFAAQMKSFSEMPPMECVLNSTRQRL